MNSNDRALRSITAAGLGVQAALVRSSKSLVRGRAQTAPKGEKEPFPPAGITRGAVPSTTAPGRGQNPQPFLCHPSPHALPAPSRAAGFLRSAGRGERWGCPACISLPANGNSGSGPRSGFPRSVQPSEKLAMVLLPSARGSEQGWEPGKGEVRVSRRQRRRRLRPAAHRARYRGELPAASRFGGTLEAQFPSLSHLGADL